jgi:hypothetical protein
VRNRGESRRRKPGAGQVKQSDPDDVAGLRALGAVDDFELDVLALFE